MEKLHGELGPLEVSVAKLQGQIMALEQLKGAYEEEIAMADRPGLAPAKEKPVEKESRRRMSKVEREELVGKLERILSPMAGQSLKELAEKTGRGAWVVKATLTRYPDRFAKRDDGWIRIEPGTDGNCEQEGNGQGQLLAAVR